MKTCPSCNNLNPSDATTCSRCGADLGGTVAATAAARVIGPGSVLGGGRYRLDALLGEGGMGSVYRATDTRLSREVALKILGGGLLQHEQARARMSREAEALARIEHRNVVQIRDVFDDGPYLVLVLELVTGGDLRGRIERGALEESEALRIIAGVLEGLSALHEAGLIHRDIKPGNILLTEDGVPKVTDLGIAHDGQGRSMTRTGALLGTVHYMAPEQIKGGSIDARTDVYASGVVLFELLTGQPPFDGQSDWEIQTAHVQHTPDTGLLEGQVSPHVLTAIERALEKEPEDRWQSTSAMRAGLLEPGDAPRRPAKQNRRRGASRASAPAPQAPASARSSAEEEQAAAEARERSRLRAKKGQGIRPEFKGRATRGEFLKARREWRGLTREEVAQKIGYPDLTVGARKLFAWENGRDVSQKHISAYAKVLRIKSNQIGEVFPESYGVTNQTQDAGDNDGWGCGWLLWILVPIKVLYWLDQL